MCVIKRAGRLLLLLRQAAKAHQADLLDALVEELEAGVAVADEGALLDELGEHLRARELRVELLLSAIARLEEAWKEETRQRRKERRGPAARRRAHPAG